MNLRITFVSLVLCAYAQSQTVTLSDVNGLSQALAIRPEASVGFTPNRASIIDANGKISSATGNLSDCVRVDGTSMPCGSYVDSEIPTGALDGSNTSFVLSATPYGNSLTLYRNGLLTKNGTDYNLAGNIVTFLPCCVPGAGDILMASYRVSSQSSSRELDSSSRAFSRFMDHRLLHQLIVEVAQQGSAAAGLRSLTSEIGASRETPGLPHSASGSNGPPRPPTVNYGVSGAAIARISQDLAAPESTNDLVTAAVPPPPENEPRMPRSLKIISRRAKSQTETTPNDTLSESSPNDEQQRHPNLPPSLRLIRRLRGEQEQ